MLVQFFYTKKIEEKGNIFLFNYLPNKMKIILCNNGLRQTSLYSPIIINCKNMPVILWQCKVLTTIHLPRQCYKLHVQNLFMHKTKIQKGFLDVNDTSSFTCTCTTWRWSKINGTFAWQSINIVNPDLRNTVSWCHLAVYNIKTLCFCVERSLWQFIWEPVQSFIQASSLGSTWGLNIPLKV